MYVHIHIEILISVSALLAGPRLLPRPLKGRPRPPSQASLRAVPSPPSLGPSAGSPIIPRRRLPTLPRPLCGRRPPTASSCQSTFHIRNNASG